MKWTNLYPGGWLTNQTRPNAHARQRSGSARVKELSRAPSIAKSRSNLLRRTRWLDGTHDDPRKIIKIMEQTLQTLLHRATRPPLPRPHHRSPALSSLIWSLSSSSTHPHSFALSQQSSSSSSSSASSLPSSRSRLHTARPALPTRTPHHATLGQTRSASTMRQPKQTFAKREAKLAAEEMDEEEQLRQMQRVLANEDRVQIDMWASKMDTLGSSLKFLLNLLQIDIHNHSYVTCFFAKKRRPASGTSPSKRIALRMGFVLHRASSELPQKCCGVSLSPLYRADCEV